MSDDSDNLDHLPHNHPLRAAVRHREEARRLDEALARHQTSPAVQEWLKQFRDDGRGFLESFADHWTESLGTGRAMHEREQAEDETMQREGKRRLWEIQQRKLFLLQVRWRAGEATIITDPKWQARDFAKWGHKIKNCTWLPPITAAEAEDYCAYLVSPDCHDADPDTGQVYDWQDYDTFKSYVPLQDGSFDPAQVRWQTAPPYPGWYAWCDRRDGPPNLLLTLPNLRGFRNAPGSYDRPDDDDNDNEPDPFLAGILRPVPPAPPPAPVPTGPPVLGFADFAGLTATLMRAVETPEMQRYHQACLPPPAEQQPDAEAARQERKLNEVGHEAGRRLAEMPVRLPIAAAADWREALYHTWLDWRKQRLAGEVRAAFAKYQARLARPQRPHLF